MPRPFSDCSILARYRYRFFGDRRRAIVYRDICVHGWLWISADHLLFWSSVEKFNTLGLSRNRGDLICGSRSGPRDRLGTFAEADGAIRGGMHSNGVYAPRELRPSKMDVTSTQRASDSEVLATSHEGSAQLLPLSLIGSGPWFALIDQGPLTPFPL